MTNRSLLAVPLAALLSACAAQRPPSTGRAGAPVSPDEAAGQAMAADAGFSSATVAKDARAFASFISRDAVFVGPRGVSAGVAAVCTDWGPLLAPGGPTLSWRPVSARASSGGDLVVTQGTWALLPADGGEARTGRYVTVWEREQDRKLRVALDAPDSPLPPESARAERRALKRVFSEDERLSAVAGLLIEGGREVGGFMLVEVLEGDRWQVLIEVGSYRPDRP